MEYFLVFFVGFTFGFGVTGFASHLLRKYLFADAAYDLQIIKEDLQNLTVKFQQLSDKMAPAIHS